MGTAGFTLAWEPGIAKQVRNEQKREEQVRRESRVASEEVQPGSEDLRTASERVASEEVQADSEDLRLAAVCAAGEPRGFEELYRLQGARMKNLARNLLGSQIDAEDAVQETFLKVHRSIASFRGQSSFVTWTFRILVNTCYDMRRRRVRRKENTTENTSESYAAEVRAAGAHPSLRMALESAIKTLTQHQRDVFLLYEVEGFRHAEIAGVLEITETASKNTLFQAKRNLRQLLEAPRGAQMGGAQ